jgi:hypothetical protein
VGERRRRVSASTTAGRRGSAASPGARSLAGTSPVAVRRRCGAPYLADITAKIGVASPDRGNYSLTRLQSFFICSYHRRLREKAECPVPSKPFRPAPLATDRPARGGRRAPRSPGRKSDHWSLELRRFGRRRRGAGGPGGKSGSARDSQARSTNFYICFTPPFCRRPPSCPVPPKPSCGPPPVGRQNFIVFSGACTSGERRTGDKCFGKRRLCGTLDHHSLDRDRRSLDRRRVQGERRLGEGVSVCPTKKYADLLIGIQQRFLP